MIRKGVVKGPTRHGFMRGMVASAAALSGCSWQGVPLTALRPAADVDTKYGVHTHNYPLDPKQFAMLTDAGFTRVRLGFVPAYARHDAFATYDAMIGAYANAGIKPLLCLSNPLSRQDVRDLIEIAPMAAERYADRVEVELFNEPNIPQYWASALTPESYWSLAKPVAAAWRKGYPHAIICTGGTSGSAVSWQRRLAAAGAFSSGLVDAVGVHPYGVSPIPGLSGPGGNLLDDLAVIQAFAPRLQVWITEYGERGGPPALDVSVWFALVRELRVARFIWYEMQDEPASSEPNLGLIRSDYSAKPSYFAAQRFLKPPS